LKLGQHPDARRKQTLYDQHQFLLAHEYRKKATLDMKMQKIFPCDLSNARKLTTTLDAIIAHDDVDGRLTRSKYTEAVAWWINSNEKETGSDASRI